MKTSVLIVDDSPEAREILRHCLESLEGFSVSGTAQNTWEARIEIHKNRPNWVLLDEVLPGESSLDLLKDLSEQGIPVLLMTGMENPEHDIPALAKGRLIKPSWKTLNHDMERLRDLFLLNR